MTEPDLIIPQTFRDEPRWWTEGTAWLDSLPDRVREQCRVWELTPDGPPRHGANALVLPVRQDGQPLALRMSPPDDRTTGEIHALEFWAGRGTVLLIKADPDGGASLLERLDADRSLRSVSVPAASELLGRMMLRLAVPMPDPSGVPATQTMLAARIDTMPTDWNELNRPLQESTLSAAISAARELTGIADDHAANGDLHHDQVLAGEREEWLTVDPMLLRGDRSYDLGRCLWMRLDEMPDDASIAEQLLIIARAADLDPDHARASAIFRTVDYWLWGLRNGLTYDPERCARLYAAIRS